MKVDLEKRLPVWEKNGWVSKEGAASILEGETKKAEDSAGASFGSRMALMGALLIGVGAVSFVAANWSGMPKALQSILVLSFLLATLFAAFWTGQNKGRWLSESLFLVSVLAVGANIGLQAQIFHMPSSGNAGVLLWFFGALAVAWLGGSSVAGFAAMAVGMVWAFMELLGGPRLFSGGSGGSNASFFWFLLMWAACAPKVFDGGGRVLKIAAANALLVGMGGTIVATAMLHTTREGDITALLSSYCLALMLVVFAARRLGSRFKDADVFLYSAITGLSLLLFLFTFRALSEPKAWNPTGVAAALPFVFGAALLFSGGFVLARLEQRTAQINFGFAVMFGWILLLTVIKPPLVPALAFFLLTNVLYALSLVWALRVASETGSAKLVNTCFLMFFIWLMSRYFDMFGSLLDRSLFFMGGGVLLIGAAVFLERQRRLIQRQVSQRGMS